MAAEFIRLYEENPEMDKIEQIVKVLQNGGVIIYPTDTLYGLGCDLFNTNAIEKVMRIKGTKAKNINLSFICYDLSHISEFVKSLDNSTFKAMKKALPGPFTFILNSSSRVPKILNVKKKTVGIRIPNNNIPREIVRVLGHPIITTSIHEDDDIIEYSTDPSLIHEKFENLVDIVIDGGPGHLDASTVIDCTSGEMEIVREGLGDPDLIL
ncbi:MAG: L-threonylcarbamoyladenylate synthase [bacterium]|nr:L-threonylcarbamoyladenylate synthase [bacterium]